MFVMAIPVQNINHSAFRSMFEKEKLSGNNFNDWFARLKLVLRVEKKMHVIECLYLLLPEAGALWPQWTALYMLILKIVVLCLGPNNPKSTAKEAPQLRMMACHHCKEVGHWKRTVMCNMLSAEKRKQVALQVPSVLGLRAFCDEDTPNKLRTNTVKCIFMMIPKGNDGLQFLLPTENKIVVARYAEFFEKRLIGQEISGRAVDLEEIQDEEDTTSFEITSNIPQEVEGFEPPQEEVIPIRRSERPHRAPNRLCLNVEVEEHSLGDLNEPTSYKAAMLDSESNKWIDAMNAEIQSMMDNMVWVLVDLPPGCKTVGSRWLFKKKTDMDGIVHVYKARLVAKGYTQLYGVDYEETFSPVADIRAIRILISIAAYYDYEIWQMDVKTAFLNGYLDEDIYMVQPEGFVDPNHPRKVCKLQRSIYGLKQASRSWNKRFDEEIKRVLDFSNHDEPWLNQKDSGSN
ncbi:retrotransposon protein, putative, ty1-copia subclass [Tanacetum coccineum]